MAGIIQGQHQGVLVEARHQAGGARHDPFLAQDGQGLIDDQDGAQDDLAAGAPIGAAILQQAAGLFRRAGSIELARHLFGNADPKDQI